MIIKSGLGPCCPSFHNVVPFYFIPDQVDAIEICFTLMRPK
jgi:hypothetical protein